jgi:hypothetical protein
MCNRGFARDCLKSGCKCYKKENYSMTMDGMESFTPPTSEKEIEEEINEGIKHGL